MPTPHPRIFISHISDEQEVALAIQELIEAVFLHTDVYVSSSPVSNPAGNAWYDNMLANLREAAAVVIVCSERSIDRPWVNFETGAGIARKVPVIPLIHSGLELSSIRIPFSLLQAKKATDAQHLVDVVASLAEVLSARIPKSIEAQVNDAVARIELFERGYCMTPEVIQIYQESRDSQIEIGARLARCRERAILCGVHFAISLSDWRSDYLGALGRGVDLDIVMLDPQSAALETTARSYGMSEEELRRECVDSLEKAKVIRSEAKSIGCGCVRIFLMSALPRARYYIFDPLQRFGVLTFTAYLEGVRSSYSPTVAYRGDSAIAVKYYQICERIIESSSLVP